MVRHRVVNSSVMDVSVHSSQVEALLLQALADTADTATPLRRRAALVVARWVGKMGEGDRPPAYDALLTLLDSGDAALQLAAISALQVLLA